jgi:hypothetical protein
MRGQSKKETDDKGTLQLAAGAPAPQPLEKAPAEVGRGRRPLEQSRLLFRRLDQLR